MPIITLKQKKKVKTDEISIDSSEEITKITIPFVSKEIVDIDITWDVLKFYAKDCKLVNGVFLSKETNWRH